MTIRTTHELTNDEALARALQEEYEREYRRSRHGGQTTPAAAPPPSSRYRPAPSAPPPPPSPRGAFQYSDGSNRSPSQRRIDQHHQQQRHGNYQQHRADSDAALAQRLAMEERHRVSTNAYGGAVAAVPGARSSSRHQHRHPVVMGTAVVQDHDLAIRMEQEARDEAYARHIAEYQQQQMSTTRAQQLQTADRRGGGCQSACGCLVGLVIVAAAVAGLAYYFLQSDNLPSLPEFGFPDTDPFAEMDPNDANRWRNSGNGLTLTVINALDERWHSYFNTAIDQWDAGAPDSLSLGKTSRQPESGCSAVTGFIKVCNGNYGETNWRGINKILLDPSGFVYASSARMNEHYFRGEDAAQRQYTMCHEIGHGFGLPHTDDNFFNRDLGNCMDYTNRPEANQQPDEMNFKFLAELYGVIPGSPTMAPVAAPTEVVQEAEAVPGPGKRLLKAEQDGQQQSRKLARILESLDALDDELNTLSDEERKTLGWTIRHKNEHFEELEKKLEGGYRVEVHMLLAS